MIGVTDPLNEFVPGRVSYRRMQLADAHLLAALQPSARAGLLVAAAQRCRRCVSTARAAATASGARRRDRSCWERLRAPLCSAVAALCVLLSDARNVSVTPVTRASEQRSCGGTCGPPPHMTSHGPAKRPSDQPPPQPRSPSQIPPSPAASHGRSLMLLSRPQQAREGDVADSVAALYALLGGTRRLGR